MNKKRIVIAGAGIGGLVAAILLKGKGFPVSVFEKRHDCGARFHGDWQGIENWSRDSDVIEDLNKLRINIADIAIPVNHFTVFSHKRAFPASSSRPVFYLVKRGLDDDSLDQRLKLIAIARGVNINFNTAITDESNVDIVATGPSPKRSTYVAKGLNFATDCDNVFAMHLDTNLFPYGYAYFLVMNRQATIALCGKKDIFDASQEAINNAIAFFRHKFGAFEIRDRKYFGGYGVTPLVNISSDKRPLVVGEAAGLQDNLFGFGMRYAFRSAAIAADCIAYGGSYQYFFKNDLALSTRAIRLWGKIIFGSKNFGVHFLCSRAQKDCLPMLKFLYGINRVTKIMGTVFR